MTRFQIPNLYCRYQKSTESQLGWNPYNITANAAPSGGPSELNVEG